MVNTSKLVVAIVILSFWFVLPIPLMLMGIGGYEEVLIEITTSDDEVTLLNYIGIGWGYLKWYGQLFFFAIPSVNAYILRFVNLLQLISGIVFYLLLRGD